ncbi:MAG: polysaccharide pyruvyl transferase family protein [Phycisphaerae bacterium]|nr:polysaccharide pyruvyl transferase family protein [Phycisphaerae bacterium]
MNPELVERISGEKPIPVPKFGKVSGAPIHLVIGSVLHWADDNTIVWGTGFGTPDALIRAKPIEVRAVRGPLSRKRLVELNVSCPEIYGDPAMLYPRYYEPQSEVKYDLGIVPHRIEQKNTVVRRLANMSDKFCFVDVTQRVNKVVDKISQCRMIASSSLHGIIVAHSYGLKALHVNFGGKSLIKDFKFHDYYHSLGIDNYDGPVLVEANTCAKEFIDHISKTTIDFKADLDGLLNACPFYNRMSKDNEKTILERQ